MSGPLSAVPVARSRRLTPLLRMVSRGCAGLSQLAGLVILLGACASENRALERGAESSNSVLSGVGSLEQQLIICGDGGHVDPGGVGQGTPQTLQLPNGVFFDNVLLGAAEYLQTSADVDVSTGTVVSMGASGATIGQNNSVADLYSSGALIVGDNVVRSGVIVSESTVTVGANVDTANITQNGSFAPENTFEFFSVDPPGGDNGNVNSGTEELEPGAYGFYSVGSATLQLSSGIYAFDQLVLNSGSELLLNQASGPIVIHLGAPGTWQGSIAVQGGGDPDLLVVYMGSSTLNLNSAVDFFVLAPNAVISFNGAGPYVGTFYANEIQVNANASFTHRPAQLTHFFPPQLPARIEAEAYDRFQDTDTGNNGASADPECDRGDDVDIQLTSDSSGVCNVAWTEAGEWLEYDVVVNEATNFDIVARLASNLTGKTVTIKVDGGVVGTLNVPSSAWQSWEDRTLSSVAFLPGSHVVRVEFDTGDTNLNYLEFVEIGASLVSANFNSGADGFTYADDAFRGTSQPNYADGSATGGALQVVLGGIDGADILDMSGGFSVDFTLSEAAAVDISLDWDLVMVGYDPDECSEVLLSVDGVLYGSGSDDWVHRRCDDGTASGTFSTTTSSLSAGSHTLTIGGFNNKKTAANEETTITLDNVFVFESL